MWDLFAKGWALTYTGTLDTFQIDRGTQFVARECKLLLASDGVSHVPIGVESHRSNGKVELSHYPLCTVCNKRRRGFPKLAPEMVLRMACKAINEIGGSPGLTPTMLVDGTMPRAHVAGLSVCAPQE